MTVTTETVWRALERVSDPEIPSLSVIDLGLIQEVQVEHGRVHVAMTPTFVGCPATHIMRQNIRDEISALGSTKVEVELRLDPPWNSNRITPEGRRKLKEFGLAPPAPYAGEFNVRLMDQVRCPFCDSPNVHLENAFGPTLCRAIYYCNTCQQPFEQFKPL